MHAENIAIVGGTGFEQLPPEIYAEPMEVETQFGKAQVLSVSDNYVEPFKLYFLSRHGADHSQAPHQINYRANIAALQQLEVRYVFATNAVGSLRPDLPPGSLVLFDDFIDFTRSRHTTLFESNWKHVDFSSPYSARLRDVILRSADQMGVTLVARGTYVCCDGPRFETPAEVRLFRTWGGDVVGMTGLPEAIFAQEAGMDYSALGIVTNLGAGLSNQIVDHQDVVRVMENVLTPVRDLLMTASGMLIEAIRPQV